MEGRETRFTAEVLAEAKKRLDALHTESEDLGADSPEVQLAWSVFAAEELAIDYTCTQTLRRARMGGHSPDLTAQVAMAFCDGMLLGALAADICYERSLGLDLSR